jgi:hypothetical protein
MSEAGDTLGVMYPKTQRDEALRLLDQGLTLSQAHRRTGISRAAMRDWLSQPRRNEERLSGCPRCEDRALDGKAYSALLGFYLGDGCISRMPRYFALRISCDLKYPSIIDDVSHCVAAVRPHGRVYHVVAPGCVVVQAGWQHWPCLFPQHGVGRKHERSIALEDWQRDLVRAHPTAFLRGLFHSDGSRSRNWTHRLVAGEMKRYDYPRWQFTNVSTDIRELCCWALDLVDIPWRQSNWKTISVSTRAGVARLDELIGLKQ